MFCVRLAFSHVIFYCSSHITCLLRITNEKTLYAQAASSPDASETPWAYSNKSLAFG